MDVPCRAGQPPLPPEKGPFVLMRHAWQPAAGAKHLISKKGARSASPASLRSRSSKLRPERLCSYVLYSYGLYSYGPQCRSSDWSRMLLPLAQTSPRHHHCFWPMLTPCSHVSGESSKEGRGKMRVCVCTWRWRRRGGEGGQGRSMHEQDSRLSPRSSVVAGIANDGSFLEKYASHNYIVHNYIWP